MGSSVLCLFAIGIGYYLFRSLSTYPGVRSLAFLVPALVVAVTLITL